MQLKTALMTYVFPAARLGRRLRRNVFEVYKTNTFQKDGYSSWVVKKKDEVLAEYNRFLPFDRLCLINPDSPKFPVEHNMIDIIWSRMHGQPTFRERFEERLKQLGIYGKVVEEKGKLEGEAKSFWENYMRAEELVR